MGTTKGAKDTKGKGEGEKAKREGLRGRPFLFLSSRLLPFSPRWEEGEPRKARRTRKGNLGKNLTTKFTKDTKNWVEVLIPSCL